MKEKKLVIQIRRPPKDIIAFLLDPKNTPKWIDSIAVERTNEWPPRVGTIYRNQNKRGAWSEYKMIALQNNVFEFASTTSTYHVRYTLRPISSETTELEYFEWVEEGEIPEPFALNILRKLKALLQS